VSANRKETENDNWACFCFQLGPTAVFRGSKKQNNKKKSNESQKEEQDKKERKKTNKNEERNKRSPAR